MSEEKKIPPQEIPQDHQVKKDSIDETISPTEPVAEAEQPPSTNLSSEALAKEDTQSQTEENMEVHHHTHSSHGKKTWKDYFWEFLMLFLAVFCGFLAEYQLEHKIEKDRSKQYIRSFYDDLHANLPSFSRILEVNEEKTASFSNIFLCYDSISTNMANTTCLTHMLKKAQYFITLALADGTVEQLKNAGGLRLLDKEDRDSIIAYDQYTRNYGDWEATAMQHSQDNVRNTFDLLGNFEVNKFLYTDSISVYKTPLYSPDKNSVNKMFNVLYRYRQNIRRQSQWMISLNKQTDGLIKYFNSKYHYK